MSVPGIVRWGGLDSCPHVSPTAFCPFTVHACKDPCHRSAVRYTTKSLPKDDPHYLSLELVSPYPPLSGEPQRRDLYLNIIDPPIPLFQLETFRLAMGFIEKRLPDGDVMVHCNEGRSRAPSIVLLWLAKAGELPKTSYQLAATTFRARGLTIPYRPGEGISKFLAEHWHELIE